MPARRVAAIQRIQGAPATPPFQVLSDSSVLTNGDFTSWTADNPDWWVNDTEVGSDPMVTQVDPSGGAGSGAARFYSSGTSRARLRKAGVFTPGQFIYSEADVSAYVGGALSFQDATNIGLVPSMTAARQYCGLAQVANNEVVIQSNAGGVLQDVVLNSVSSKVITVNPEVTFSSPNMVVRALFDLPGVPLVGARVMLLGRISSLPGGNYLLVSFLYNPSLTWEVRLYSVAGYLATQLIAPVTGLGTVNGLQLTASGNNLSMFTSEDRGQNWTQRGGTVVNSIYNTATKYTVVWTPGIQMTDLLAASP